MKISNSVLTIAILILSIATFVNTNRLIEVTKVGVPVSVELKEIPDIRIVHVTGYLPTGNKASLGTKAIAGKTAAISHNCIDWLGSDVFILGHGIRYINDLTHKKVSEDSNICIIDIVVPTKEHAYKITNTNGTKAVKIK